MQLLSSRRWRAAAASAAMLGLVLTGCSADESFTYTPPAQVDAALPEATVTAMQGALDNALAASGASGAIVGVWVPWSGSWVTAVGTQEREGGDELTTEMSFRIADVTRLMTCDVLYALADEGVVELDATVPEHVSGVADMKDVTLLDLCNGTSGAASSEPTVKSAWLNTPERVWAPLELAGFGLGRDRVAPHTTFRDSDSGYLLLGLALERVSGMTAAELIQEYVAEPLDLANTALPSPAAAPPSSGPVMNGHYMPTAEGGFNCAAPIDITTMSSSAGFTDSGVVSTIDDLGRYAQAQAAQVLREKDEPNRYASPLPVGKSASWFQATGGAYLVGSLVGQHGWTPGYATAAYADPETGFTVAVVLNDSTAGSKFAQQLSWELAAIASKAPAASGETAPEFGLPFTAEQYHQSITEGAVACVAPPAE